MVLVLVVVCAGSPAIARAGGKGDEPASNDKVEVAEKATKAGGLRGAKKIAGKVNPLLTVSELMDEATTTTDGVKLKSRGSTPVREKTYFGVRYTVPKVTFTDYYTNTVLGREVPGRRVTVTITVDCNVDCQVLVDEITFAWSKDKPKTLIVTVPPIEVVGSVPSQEYPYEVYYGEARNRDLNTDDAKVFRKEMIRKVGDVATDEFKKGEVFKALEEGLQSELQEFIAAGCPKGTTVVVVFGGK
ncbi:MAG: hypothetical protein JWO38_1152 [Gemmataceae bacterium]|nr:hypothetical protein [Gemmataceae bacterium]